MPETALITGASSGIGLALARHAAREGHDLLLTALPGPELDLAGEEIRREFPGTNVWLLPADLSAPTGVDALWASMSGRTDRIDLLVNNAGFATWGEVGDLDPERESDMIRLNVLAVYKLTRLVLDHMRQRDHGRILFVSSITAFQPNPYMATYGATKAFVRHFALALRRELLESRSSVKVTVVCPPAVPTAFRRVAGMDTSTLFHGPFSSDVETVANAAWKGLIRGERQVIPTWYLPILHPLLRWLPETWSTAISGRMLRQGLKDRT